MTSREGRTGSRQLPGPPETKDTERQEHTVDRKFRQANSKANGAKPSAADKQTTSKARAAPESPGVGRANDKEPLEQRLYRDCVAQFDRLGTVFLAEDLVNGYRAGKDLFSDDELEPLWAEHIKRFITDTAGQQQAIRDCRTASSRPVELFLNRFFKRIGRTTLGPLCDIRKMPSFKAEVEKLRTTVYYATDCQGYIKDGTKLPLRGCESIVI